MRRWMTVIGVIVALAAFGTLTAFAASFAETPAPRDSDLPRIVAQEVPGAAAAGPSAGATDTGSSAATPTNTAHPGNDSPPAPAADSAPPSSGSSAPSAGSGDHHGSSASTGSDAAGSGTAHGDESPADMGHNKDHEVVAPPVHDSDENGHRNSD